MSLIGGLTDFLSGGNQSRAAGASQASVDALSSLQLPDVSQMQIQLDQLVQQGLITPEEAQAELQQASLMSGISTDPAFQQAQLDALLSLQEVGEGGMTDMDRANLARIQREEQTASRGAREAILADAAARGVGGSGLELMAQLKNQQDAATRQSTRDLDVAGMSQERALQALQQAGQLGGQMQATSFNQQAQQAEAQDAINRFNAQNMSQFNLANTQMRNQAQQANLAEKQRVADANVNLKNQQQQYNKQLAQQDFENRYKKAGGVAGAYQNQAGQFNQAGQQNMQLIGSGIQAGATVAASDEDLKDDIEDFDASDFLDSLTGYTYRYKDPAKHGEGKFAGPMAQDLEKSEVGRSMVHEGPDGKMVDTGRAAMVSLGSLSNIHKRLKELEKGKGK